MGYIISVIVSVLILGTLLINTNYKERRRKDEYKRWDMYEFVDKGRVKFPVWLYLISALSSIVFIWNYIYTFSFVFVWMILRFKENESNCGESLVEIKVYLNNKVINKIIKFLNKGI